MRVWNSLIDAIIKTHDGKVQMIDSAIVRVHLQAAAGELFFYTFGAIAKFERQLIRERTNAGLAAARARGRKGGRPRKLSRKDSLTIKTLYDARQIPVAEIGTVFGVSRTTIYQSLALLPKENITCSSTKRK